MLPSLPPLQLMLYPLCCDSVWLFPNTAGSVSVTLSSFDVQLLTLVTITLYVPAVRPVGSSTIPWPVGIVPSEVLHA